MAVLIEKNGGEGGPAPCSYWRIGEWHKRGEQVTVTMFGYPSEEARRAGGKFRDRRVVLIYGAPRETDDVTMAWLYPRVMLDAEFAGAEGL